MPIYTKEDINEKLNQRIPILFKNLKRGKIFEHSWKQDQHFDQLIRTFEIFYLVYTIGITKRKRPS